MLIAATHLQFEGCSEGARIPEPAPNPPTWRISRFRIHCASRLFSPFRQMGVHDRRTLARITSLRPRLRARYGQRAASPRWSLLSDFSRLLSREPLVTGDAVTPSAPGALSGPAWARRLCFIPASSSGEAEAIRPTEWRPGFCLHGFGRRSDRQTGVEGDACQNDTAGIAAMSTKKEQPPSRSGLAELLRGCCRSFFHKEKSSFFRSLARKTRFFS